MFQGWRTGLQNLLGGFDSYRICYVLNKTIGDYIMGIVKVVLYGVFGMILGQAGVGALEEPGYFFSLLGILLAVDLISTYFF
jgi:hypothetical protein